MRVGLGLVSLLSAAGTDVAPAMEAGEAEGSSTCWSAGTEWDTEVCIAGVQAPMELGVPEACQEVTRTQPDQKPGVGVWVRLRGLAPLPLTQSWLIVASLT